MDGRGSTTQEAKVDESMGGRGRTTQEAKVDESMDGRGRTTQEAKVEERLSALRAICGLVSPDSRCGPLWRRHPSLIE